MPTPHTEPRAGKSAKAAADAIALLKADHREVLDWFDDFEGADNGSSKQKLADQICLALKVHTQIEQEIFYPACREGGVESATMDEADVEHEGAEKLIAEIEANKAGGDHFDAQVHVLGEMIKHHVKEEEGRDGIFSQAKKAGLDMNELGEELQRRKTELMKRMKNGKR